MVRVSDAELMDPVFMERWSTRAFSPEPVRQEHLVALFEAARWAPSWMNNQPWVFLYETDGPDRAGFEEILDKFNREWAAMAPVVGLIISRPGVEGFMARTADFDTGAAAMSLTIQATKLGLWVHLMGGIELDLAYERTGLDPDEANILCAFALGHRGDVSQLSERKQAREVPSARMPAIAFAFKRLRPDPRPE